MVRWTDLVKRCDHYIVPNLAHFFENIQPVPRSVPDAIQVEQNRVQTQFFQNALYFVCAFRQDRSKDAPQVFVYLTIMLAFVGNDGEQMAFQNVRGFGQSVAPRLVRDYRRDPLSEEA
jgi:hypothetical protein